MTTMVMMIFVLLENYAMQYKDKTQGVLQKVIEADVILAQSRQQPHSEGESPIFSFLALETKKSIDVSKKRQQKIQWRISPGAP